MKRSNILLVLIFSLFAVTSCKDWLDLEPEGEATSSKLTETGDGFRSMLSGVYKAMGSANLYGCELQFGLLDCMSQQYSWNWVSTETSSVIQKYLKARDYDYYDIDLRNAIDAIWKDGFNVIANANNLIQELEKASPDIFAKGETERKMILGEAYACRALMHFDLLRLFAPAPIENEAGAYVPYSGCIS